MKISKCPIYDELYSLYKSIDCTAPGQESGGDIVLGDVDLLEVHSDFHQGILTKLLPYHEDYFMEKLKPHAFWGFRKYKRGSELKPHTDMPDTHHRGSSITIDYSHDWDFYIEGQPVSLSKGDMVTFNTVDQSHWRLPFNGEFYVNCYVHYQKL